MNTTRTRDQFGVAFPSPLVMLSIIAIAMAGFAFVATRDAAPIERKVDHGRRRRRPRPPRPRRSRRSKTPKPKPTVKRGEVYVEVFNNSGIKGLAATTAAKATQVGWQVVGEDNWVGSIPASTVYYPARLKAAAKLLALDLGIGRTKPAVEPMKMDRLTIVLTADVRPDAASPGRCCVELVPHGVHLRSGPSSVRRHRARAPTRSSSASTSTARCRRSSRPDAGAHPRRTRRRCSIDLAELVRAVAVVTGRPARQVLALGGLDEVGDAIGDHGRSSSSSGSTATSAGPPTQRRVDLAAPPHGLSSLRARAAGAAAAQWRERRLRRGEGAGGRRAHPTARGRRRRRSSGCSTDARRWRAAHGLIVEPGRIVIEVRADGHATRATPCRRWSTEQNAGGVALRRRRPGRHRGVRGGRRAARAGAGGVAGLLWLGRAVGAARARRPGGRRTGRRDGPPARSSPRRSRADS